LGFVNTVIKKSCAFFACTNLDANNYTADSNALIITATRSCEAKQEKEEERQNQKSKQKAAPRFSEEVSACGGKDI